MIAYRTDTNSAAAAMQFELLRHASSARRLDLAADMTSFAIEAAFAALRRRHPHIDDHEIRLLFVEQQYGAALAARMRAAGVFS